MNRKRICFLFIGIGFIILAYGCMTNQETKLDGFTQSYSETLYDAIVPLFWMVGSALVFIDLWLLIEEMGDTNG